ncbi:MAG: hypothetical protein KF718_18465 [Polyangiaceae bacterium]|nr:hypothetical protein [Polyangiaceae bacterium]
MAQPVSVQGGFQLDAGFVAGEVSGGFGLGPLEEQYESIFAEALEDGVITQDERARLERAADNLGLDRGRLARLEQAMVSAYEAHHKVRIVEHYEQSPQSLSPLQVDAAGDPGRTLLLKRIEGLEARVRELEEELRRAQAQVNVEVDLSDLEATSELAQEDPEQAWRRVRRDPLNPEAVRALHRIHQARGDRDAAWCCAAALVALGAASPEERAAFEAQQTAGLIAAKTSVSANAWHDLLMHPEQELLTGQIFAVVAPAVLLGRVTALRRDGQLHQPAAALRQDPAQATVTAVRAIPWGAAMFGLPVPPIFLEKDRDVGFEHIPGVPPVTVVGRRVLSGRTQPEHAFLVGRHLTYYRADHFLKTLFSSVQDLEDLFLAALVIGNPGLPIAEDMKRRVSPMAGAMEPLLEPQQKDMLRGYFLRFVEEGGRTNLMRWSESVDKTACRAGLLLANDLVVAQALLEEQEGSGGPLFKDLVGFACSERYAKLRKQIGIAIA